jgi:acyl carrier protein
MPDSVADRVIRVIARTQKLPDGRVSDTSTFKELNIDSLDGLNILFALEEEFDVSVPDDAALDFKSVPEIVAGIERLLADKTA